MKKQSVTTRTATIETWFQCYFCLLAVEQTNHQWPCFAKMSNSCTCPNSIMQDSQSWSGKLDHRQNYCSLKDNFPHLAVDKCTYRQIKKVLFMQTEQATWSYRVDRLSVQIFSTAPIIIGFLQIKYILFHSGAAAWACGQHSVVTTRADQHWIIQIWKVTSS